MLSFLDKRLGLGGFVCATLHQDPRQNFITVWLTRVEQSSCYSPITYLYTQWETHYSILKTTVTTKPLLRIASLIRGSFSVYSLFRQTACFRKSRFITLLYYVWHELSTHVTMIGFCRASLNARLLWHRIFVTISLLRPLLRIQTRSLAPQRFTFETRTPFLCVRAIFVHQSFLPTLFIWFT